MARAGRSDRHSAINARGPERRRGSKRGVTRLNIGTWPDRSPATIFLGNRSLRGRAAVPQPVVELAHQLLGGSAITVPGGKIASAPAAFNAS
jgi:hypothetical protein